MIDWEPRSFTTAGLDGNGVSEDDNATVGSVGFYDAEISRPYIVFIIVMLYYSSNLTLHFFAFK